MTDTTQLAIVKRPLKWGRVLDHLVLILGALFMLIPLLMVLQLSLIHI